MNKTIELGCMNLLQIYRISEPGLYLKALDEQEVLLPNAYITSTMQLNDTLEVFIYTDSEDRLVATTQIPKGLLHDYISAEVVDTVPFGAFVDWGLPKDLLVPKNRQKSTFAIGSTKVIQIVEDEKTHRLIGTEKFVLNKEPKHFKRNDEVDILVYMKTPLGFKVIVNNQYEGLIFHNEIFQKINIGYKKKAYIKHIREDGKLDISLQKIGEAKQEDNHQKVLSILQQNNSTLPFTYKSDAQDIQEMFGLSKKAFKAALTQLLQKELILLDESGIRLNQ